MKPYQRYNEEQNEHGLVKVGTWVPKNRRKEFLEIADRMRREEGFATRTPRGPKPKL